MSCDFKIIIDEKAGSWQHIRKKKYLECIFEYLEFNELLKSAKAVVTIHSIVCQVYQKEIRLQKTGL